MNAAPPSDFLTPRGPTLTLRGADDPTQQQTVQRGESLAVVARLQSGFVEVEYHGRRWLATESALEPLRSGFGAVPPPNMPPPPRAGAVAFGAPGARAPAKGARFPGAVLIGRILLVLGFIVLGLGIIFAILFSVAYSQFASLLPQGSAGSGDAVVRLMLFVGPILGACLYALPLWASGYILLLLDAVESNTRT